MDSLLLTGSALGSHTEGLHLQNFHLISGRKPPCSLCFQWQQLPSSSLHHPAKDYCPQDQPELSSFPTLPQVRYSLMGSHSVLSSSLAFQKHLDAQEPENLKAPASLQG